MAKRPCEYTKVDENHQQLERKLSSSDKDLCKKIKSDGELKRVDESVRKLELGRKHVFLSNSRIYGKSLKFKQEQ